MHANSMLSETKFWLVVDYILEEVEEVEVSVLLEKLDLSKEQFHCFYTFFKDLGLDVSMKEESFLIKGKKDIEFKMNLSQWLKFQAHFPAIESLKSEPFHQDISNLLAGVESEQEQFDLFQSIDNFEGILSNKRGLNLVGSNDFTSFIEESIVYEKPLLMNSNCEYFDIKPLRLLSLSGSLNLVFEKLGSHCLDIIEVSQIDDMDFSTVDTKGIFSNKEVEFFIKDLRSLDSCEERIILKVLDDKHFHTQIQDEFFRNEVLVRNHVGQKIWAASIEPTDKVFEWIFSLGRSIEILSSNNIKKSYLNFCQRKLKKLA